jgi:hypothetical protein
MKLLTDPESEGQEVRTGSSKSGKTHSQLPPDLRVIITAQWTVKELQAAYILSGATEEDVKAFFARLHVVDLWAKNVVTWPEGQREALEPKRVAATVASAQTQAVLPFCRQPVPAAATCFAAPPQTPAPGRLAHFSCRPGAGGRYSAPVKRGPRLLDGLDDSPRRVWCQVQPPTSRRRLSGAFASAAASSGPADAEATQLLAEEEEDEDEEEDAALALVDAYGPDAEADVFVAARVDDGEWAAAGIDVDDPDVFVAARVDDGEWAAAGIDVDDL